jgi:hypothetical protein
MGIAHKTMGKEPAMTIETIDKETFDSFLSLCSRLSPENLCCDGEASQTYIQRELKSIRAEWNKLEKKIGFKVSEDQIWNEYMINRRGR